MVDFSRARTNMMDCQIRTSGVVSVDILDAFTSTPREVFLPRNMRAAAYVDEGLFVDKGHFFLEPSVHAKMIQAVNPQQDDIALDVGAGTGYSSAILSPLVTTVIALDQQQSFLDKALNIWETHGFCNIVGVKGDLLKGNPGNAPFSLIVMNGAVPEIPAQLVKQIAPNGRLITIVRNPNEVMGQVTLVQKDGDGSVSFHPLFEAASPYLSGYEPVPAFKF